MPFWATLLTSMFLHGGFAHLGGNMLYLWIFGDNVERRLGRARFLFFYLACGVAAGLTHILFNAHSGMPTVGASGPSAACSAGTCCSSRTTACACMTSGGVTAVPAVVMLGLWILIQLVERPGHDRGNARRPAASPTWRTSAASWRGCCSSRSWARAVSGPRSPERRTSVPRTLCKVMGVVLVLVGILGFANPRLLGMHLTPMHDVIHLVSGTVAVYLGLNGSRSSVRSFCLVFGACTFRWRCWGWWLPTWCRR